MASDCCIPNVKSVCEICLSFSLDMVPQQILLNTVVDLAQELRSVHMYLGKPQPGFVPIQYTRISLYIQFDRHVTVSK